MADQPARKFNPDIEPDIRPHFGVVQGGGQSTPDRGKLSAVPDVGSDEQQVGEQSKPKRHLSAIGDANDNIDDISAQEQSGQWTTQVAGKQNANQDLKVSFVKRKGPLGFLIGLLVGGGGLAGFLLAPASLPITMMEALTNDTDDAASWNSNKVHRLFGNKLGNMQKKLGYCGRTVTIRCKFSTMSKWQADRFRNVPGISFEGEAKRGIAGGRTAFTAMVFEDPVTGERVRASNPAELNKALREKPFVRSMMYRGFNPMTSKFLGNRFGSFLLGKGLSKQKKIKGDNKEQVDQSYDESNSDEDTDDDRTRVGPADEDEAREGETEEEREQRLQNNQANNNYVNELNQSLEDGKSKLKFKNDALGVARGVCAAYTVGSLISGASKVLKAVRLAKFAMIFLTGAAAMKAGESSAAEVQKMTDILVPATYPEQVENNDGEMVDNPNIGLNALDSEAFRIIAYGDSGDLSEIASRFFVAGGVVGTLGVLLAKINKNPSVKTSLKASCKAVNSKVVGFLDAASTFFGPGGVVKKVVTLVLGAVAGKALEGLIGNALEKAINWASGKDLTTDIIGVDAGNAIFAGTAFIMSGAAATLGMKPGKASEIVKNMAANAGTQQTYIANERYNARGTPFDATNQYSFLGTILTSIRGTGSARPMSQIQSILANGLNPLKFITKDANAAYSMPITTVTEDRFKQCDDPGYENLGIDADRFCNVRMVPFEDRDIETVVDYMLENEHISEGGEPISGEFEDWIANCSQRQAGWGEDDGTSGDGSECMENSEQNINFANYIAYYGADQDMDEEPKLQEASSSALGAKFRVATFNILHGDTSNWPGRLQTSLNLLNEKGISLAGLQEARPHQQAAIKADYGDKWGIFPTTKDENPDSAVIWDKQKFELVENGSRQERIQYDGGRKVNIAKLRYIENGAAGPEFYVMNTHDPINKRATSTCKNDRGETVRGKSNCGPINRTQNARLYQRLAKEELTDAPVIMTGDFNMKLDLGGKNKPIGNIRENLTYCIMTRDDVLWYVSDAQQNKTGECPSQKDVLGENHIDQIYISTTMKASGYGVVENGTGSDHPMVYSDVEIVGSESTGAGTEFTMGTYNQPIRAGNRGYQKAVDKIADNKMDIVGMQELGGANYFYLKNKLAQKGYKVYPSINDGDSKSGHCTNARPIFYNATGEGDGRTKFNFIKAEVFDVPSYKTTKRSRAHPPYVDPQSCGNGEMTKGGGRANIPVVWLQDSATGQTIIVMNTHNLANCCGSAGVASQKRFEANQIYIEKIEELKEANPGVPIFFSGDFNEGTGVRRSGNVTYQLKHENLLYCKFKQNGLMAKALGSRDQPCRTDREGIGQVDFVYTTPGVQVKWARSFVDPSTNDHPHPVHYGRLVVPGSGGNKGEPDIVGDDYATACASGNALGVECNGECVDFVKYRLKKHVKKYGGESLGNGKDVAIGLHNRYGYKLDRKPAVHAVFSTSHTSRPQWGHTGIVSKVNADGSIVVEEYNFLNGHAYGVRKISAAELRSKEYIFAHTEVDYK